mgnify:CR=1 FL=1
MQVLQVLQAKPGFFWTLLINSCMAYAVNLTNFMVTKYTSALTLQVGADPWLNVSREPTSAVSTACVGGAGSVFLVNSKQLVDSHYAVCCG